MSLKKERNFGVLVSLSWRDYAHVLSTSYLPFLVCHRYAWKDSERLAVQAALFFPTINFHRQ